MIDLCSCSGKGLLGNGGQSALTKGKTRGKPNALNGPALIFYFNKSLIHIFLHYRMWEPFMCDSEQACPLAVCFVLTWTRALCSA